jgi:glutamyl-tRNA reductase
MSKVLKQAPSLPVNLLPQGRACLVVGGGKIAARKTGHLLKAGACVTVVSPAFCAAFDTLDVTRTLRPFEPADVEGFFLVFACTADRHVNRCVLEACRERKILCSCVDGNWVQSDFITPAISRHGDLTLTVSTGGRACRKAKLVSNSISRHLESIETAGLVVAGTDHRHLSLNAREPLHPSGERLERIGSLLMQLRGVHEFMILSTCNRIELLAVVSRETAANGVLPHILGFDQLEQTQYYIHRGVAAWEHAVLVCSGMCSQVPGETHVAGQMKQALAAAVEKGWAGGLMQDWIASVLRLSKRIKKEVVPAVAACEIEQLALRYLVATIPELQSKTVLILGAGEVGQGLVRDAAVRAGHVIWCYHTRRPEPDARWTNVECCTFDKLGEYLSAADAVISAADAPDYILHSGHAPFLGREKQTEMLDLGMPRNIDPALAELSPRIRITDLDGLKQGSGPDDGLHLCRKMIEAHQDDYEKFISSFQGGNA